MAYTKFKPGQSGNPNGRPRGAAGKVAKPLKAEIETFLSEQWPSLKNDFQKLEPKERIQMFERLLRFVLPQPRETDLKLSTGEIGENQVDEILDKLIESHGKR